MIIHVARHTVRVCMSVVGIVVILLALFTAGARLGLPMVGNYKEAIAARVSNYLKSPVDIGEISFSWEGAGPLLRAKNVAVLESPDRKVTLDELLIDLNLAKSLLRGVPIINELTLVGASFAIEADADGQFRLHGMESVRTGGALMAPESGESLPEVSSGQNKSGVDVVAWLLNASKVGLIDTQVSLIDVRAGRTLVVDELNIRAENDGDVHQLRVELNLAGELGGSLEAGIDLVGNADSLAQSNGDLYLRAEKLEVKALSELLGLVKILDAQNNVVAHMDTAVSLEMWGRWENGQLVSAHGPISTNTIVDANSGEVLLQGVSATLGLLVGVEQSMLTADDVVLSADIGESRIDASSFSWGPRGADSELNWTMDANGAQLALDALHPLPVSLLSRIRPELASQFEQIQPAGWLRDWQVSISEQAGVRTVSGHADLDQLQVSPVGALPGFGPVDGRIDMQDLQGEMTLSADAMNLPWPAFTDRALQLDTLKAVVTLDARDNQRMLVGADIALTDKGIELSTRLKTTLAPGQSPHLDAQSQYSVADINALKTWLPRQKISPNLAKWFDTAIQGGAAKNGSMIFFGNLSEFPFNESEGVFRASVDIGQASLAFLPEWPMAEQLNGTLDLNGLMLTATAEGSRLDKFDLTQTRLRINNLKAPVLDMESTGRGKLQDIIDFGRTGALRSILAPVFKEVTGTGNAEMDLALSVPLYRSKQAAAAAIKQPWPLEVNGSVFFSDNTIHFGLADMNLKNVNGAVGFDHNGITINGLRANALDRPVVVNAQTDGKGKEAITRVAITGAMQGNEALAHYGSPLDQFLRGASSWKIELSAPHSAELMARDGLRLQLQSDLVGTELLLPKPYYKSSGTATDFQLSTAFIEGRHAQAWDIRYGEQLHVNALVSAEAMESLLIHAGQGSLPQTWIDQHPPGISFQGKADTVAMDAWVDTLSTLIESIPEGPDGPAMIMPIVAELDIQTLQLGEQLLGPATIRVDFDDTYINTTIENRSVSGRVQYPREHWSKEIVMKANIDQLDTTLLTALASRKQEESFIDRSSELDPRRLPPIDARISKLTHDDYTLRDLAFRAQPDVSGLTINTLGFAYQTMRLVGQGYWRLRDPQNVNPALADQQVTQLDLVLQGDDFGEGFSHIGMKDIISDGEGDIEAHLSWPGPLYSPEIAELDGSIKMQIERGSIIPLEPGGGKMVGLFALQALPRRLELDFKDVTSDGLAFQRISGDIAIDNGVANASLLQLNGPIGVVDITGHSNINTREFDQRITVLPRISAALPVIGVISAGATGGIGALVATGFLKAVGIDLDRLGLRDYTLTGQWDDPVFEPVDSDYWRTE